MYKNIEPLRPYFFSLREIKENVSLDLRLPTSWKYQNIVQVYKTLDVKVQDKNDKNILVSFISVATEDGYDTAFQCANEVVQKNLEDEKKRELFDRKVREMRELFEKKGLNELELLKFESDVEGYNKELKLVEERNGERPTSGGDPQEKDDKGPEEDEERRFFPITEGAT